MSKKSATAKTIDAFQLAGFRIEKVEQWVPNPKHPAGGVRRDYLGVIDLLAIRPGLIVGVQSTTGNGVSDHLKKIEGSKRGREWIEAGGILVMLAWRKLKVDGKSVDRPRIFRFRVEGNTIAWDEYANFRESIPEMIKP